VLGGLWNSDDDRVEWVAGLSDVAEEAGAPVLSSRRAEAAALGPEQFGSDLFTSTERAEFPNAHSRTADSLLASLGTYSAVLVMHPAERDRLLGQIRDYLASRPETSDGPFDLPMVTSALRSVRRQRSRVGTVATETELEALSSRELHDMAVHRALTHADVKFLWELLRAIPAAEALGGYEGESQEDVVKASALLADVISSGDGAEAEALRPLYIDYLTKHPQN
jgi:hypothetical protein